ncbi:40S ribosomal protein [Saguinus oedipus]|uniref:40S ribosomal protein n=1 Tax=Saguinus oedipus TaxID=9490 RepID=A0ABQ9TFC1_SAGOE|nr:40S ribosomal protein [Saguinus oedipus]
MEHGSRNSQRLQKQLLNCQWQAAFFLRACQLGKEWGLLAVSPAPLSAGHTVSGKGGPGSDAMGISWDNWHKCCKTGGKRKPYHKKRKYKLGHPAANTKIGPRRIHTVHLVRTKTLVKNCIVLIDSTHYRQWYESHYALPLGHKKGAKLTPEEEELLNKKQSKKIQKKYDERKKNAKISSLLEEQFQQGKLLACIASRPGQCGRADGYVLEGKELEFYRRKIKAQKGK